MGNPMIFADQFSLGQSLLDVAMFIVAVIVMYNTNKRANEKRFDQKADKDVVDDKVKAIHHRIDGLEERNSITLAEIQRDIKQILKEMPR